MVMKNTKLTSVKVIESLYNKFKISTVDTKMSLQKITNRAVYLYLNDNDFKKVYFSFLGLFRRSVCVGSVISRHVDST